MLAEMRHIARYTNTTLDSPIDQVIDCFSTVASEYLPSPELVLGRTSLLYIVVVRDLTG